MVYPLGIGSVEHNRKHNVTVLSNSFIFSYNISNDAFKCIIMFLMMHFSLFLLSSYWVRIIMCLLSSWFFTSLLKYGHSPSSYGEESKSKTSLVVQRIRIRLPMKGTLVRSLVQEDSTCCGGAKPMHHNYWAPTLQSPHGATAEARVPRAWAREQRRQRDETPSLLAAARESPRTAVKTQGSQKLNK